MDDERIGGNQHRAAVRRRARDIFGADYGGGARAVFDHRCHTGIASDLFRQHAHEKIGTAAGRIRHDEADGFRYLRESLSVSNGWQQCQPGGCRSQADQSAAREAEWDLALALALALALELALAGVEGLEPPTPGFGDRCSSH